MSSSTALERTDDPALPGSGRNRSVSTPLGQTTTGTPGKAARSSRSTPRETGARAPDPAPPVAPALRRHRDDVGEQRVEPAERREPSGTRRPGGPPEADVAEVHAGHVDPVGHDGAHGVGQPGRRPGQAQAGDDEERPEAQGERPPGRRHPSPVDQWPQLGGQLARHHGEAVVPVHPPDQLGERALHAALVVDGVGDQRERRPCPGPGPEVAGLGGRRSPPCRPPHPAGPERHPGGGYRLDRSGPRRRSRRLGLDSGGGVRFARAQAARPGCAVWREAEVTPSGDGG